MSLEGPPVEVGGNEGDQEGGSAAAVPMSIAVWIPDVLAPA